MTIVVFGASSNIGRKFVQLAADKNVKIIAFARNTEKIPTSSKIKKIKGDITKLNDVKKALKGSKIEATINFAASFSGDINEARRVNVQGEKNILDASIAQGVKRHVYISTVATQTPRPNAYRDTKLEAEAVIKNHTHAKKIGWMILRFGHVLGTPTWDQAYKIIIPFVRVGVPKVPTDARNADFPYLTIDTAVEAVLSAISSKPHQTITVFDGKVAIGEYLSTMEKMYGVRISFLPNSPFQLMDKVVGKFVPFISGTSTILEFMAHPPDFENNTMKKELNIKPKNFNKWIKSHFRTLYE